MEKKCQMCGDTFTVTKGNYTYCSKCKDKFTPPGNQKSTKPKDKETPKAVNNNWCNSQSREYICQECGKAFTSLFRNAKYCSDECRHVVRLRKTNEYNIKKRKEKEEMKQDNEATISKIETVGAKDAHTDEVVAFKKEIAADENVDMVNHPPHYQLANGMESIDVIRAVLTHEEYKGWCKGNALKYQFRAGKKDPTKETEDYSKAEFYLKELRNGNFKSK